MAEPVKCAPSMIRAGRGMDAEGSAVMWPKDFAGAQKSWNGL